MPVSETDRGLPGALSLMVSAPLRAPVACGAKVTWTLQLPPVDSELPQLLVCAKSSAHRDATDCQCSTPGVAQGDALCGGSLADGLAPEIEAGRVESGDGRGSGAREGDRVGAPLRVVGDGECPVTASAPLRSEGHLNGAAPPGNQRAPAAVGLSVVSARRDVADGQGCVPVVAQGDAPCGGGLAHGLVSEIEAARAEAGDGRGAGAGEGHRRRGLPCALSVMESVPLRPPLPSGVKVT